MQGKIRIILLFVIVLQIRQFADQVLERLCIMHRDIELIRFEAIQREWKKEDELL